MRAYIRSTVKTPRKSLEDGEKIPYNTSMLETLRFRVPTKEHLSSSNTIGMIFCGGNGSRMQAITHGELPKHLLPLTHDLTILDTVAQSLRQAGVDHIVLITTHATDGHIQQHMTTRPLVYETAQIIQNPNKEKHGMGSVLAEIQRRVPLTETIIKMDGDTIHTGFTIQDMLQFHTNHDAPLTAALTKQGNFTHTVTLDENHQHVLSVDTNDVSASPHVYGITGTWIIDPSSVPLIMESPDTTTFLKRAIREDAIRCFLFDGPSVNVNTPDDYQRARLLWNKQ